MKLSTETIARAAARHPWRTVGAWAGALVIAFTLIALLLGGRLTTDGAPTNNPDSKRAKDVIATAFPSYAQRETTDIVVVRSARYSVDAPQFRAFVLALVRQGRATGVV